MTVVKYVLKDDPEVLQRAFVEIGTKEIVGTRNNPKVVDYYKRAGQGWVRDDETPWCGAFVGAMLVDSGEPIISGALGARNWLQWGHKDTSPQRGDVVVFKRGTGWQGHVAFYLGESNGRIYHLGGNQGNSVSITSTPKTKLLGYRRPVTGWNSRTVRAAAVGSSVVMAGMGTEGYTLLKGTGEQFLGLGYPVLAYIGSVLIMLAFGVIAYARYSDWHNKGR